LAEAAQYESSYRRTAHHATDSTSLTEADDGGLLPVSDFFADYEQWSKYL